MVGVGVRAAMDQNMEANMRLSFGQAACMLVRFQPPDIELGVGHRSEADASAKIQNL